MNPGMINMKISWLDAEMLQEHYIFLLN